MLFQGTPFRLVKYASKTVVPEPIMGSKTTSLGSVKSLMNSNGSCGGNFAGKE